jgi:hypothetical protein
MEHPGTDSFDVGMLLTDVIEHVNVLNGLGKRDSLLSALPRQDDVFGELHANGQVSPCDKSPTGEVREAALFDEVGQ